MEYKNELYFFGIAYLQSSLRLLTFCVHGAVLIQRRRLFDNGESNLLIRAWYFSHVIVLNNGPSIWVDSGSNYSYINSLKIAIT